MMDRVLVTGASGFVGRHLCEALARQGVSVIGAVRSLPPEQQARGYELCTVGDIGADVDWEPLLRDVDGVIHLAARVHVMKDRERDPLTAFRRVNVDGTQRLLGSNGMQGVKRFVYLSTVKVHGDTSRDNPFRADDRLEALDPYGQSKIEAEQLVRESGNRSDLETVVIRPPLVYGPGVGGNFLRLIEMVDKGVPLPFGMIENARSLVSVRNLCDFIGECILNSAAAGKSFLVSDKSDVSTPDLIRLIASSMSRPARLVPVPVALLKLLAGLAARSAEVTRLIGSLQVDIEASMKTLDWRPPQTLEDGIRSTIEWYQEQKTDAKL